MTIEEIIKVLDEIAEGFENLSAEVCARNDLRALWEGRAKGIRQALALLKPHPDAQPNEPLTLDELREMDGRPVWVQSPGIPEYGSWRIVAGVDTEDGEQTLYCQGDYTCRDYGGTWLAYRRPPKED